MIELFGTLKENLKHANIEIQ